MAALLTDRRSPEAVLRSAVELLELPSGVEAVLTGTPLDAVPGLVHHPARGLRESVLAQVRGEDDPPDSPARHHRVSRRQRQRPPTYRAARALGAVLQAGVAGWVVPDVDGDWVSWPGAAVAVLGLSAASGSWAARPVSWRARGGAPAEQ